MFSQTKQQEQIQLNYLIYNPLYRKFFCNPHGFIYQYRCVHQNCLGFICGKIQCIDQHFHGSKLSIERFNVTPIIQKIRRVEGLSHLTQTLTPTLNQLQNSIEQLKSMSANLFKQYKELKKNADYLTENAQSSLTLGYLQRMGELQGIKQKIQGQIRSISQRINWKNIWITLQDELQIIQKLKISFPILNRLYFEPYPISEQYILNRQWKLVEEEICQGIVIVYFTGDQYVMGKYISSNNIQTCQLFIRNFTFIVNQRGEMHQSPKQIITIQKQQISSQFYIKINCNSYEKQLSGRQLINKVVCFKAFIE